MFGCTDNHVKYVSVNITCTNCYISAGDGFCYKNNMLPVERSLNVFSFVICIYKIANGCPASSPSTKSCLDLF